MSYARYGLFYPSSNVLVQAGYGKIAHVPCVFDENWTYVRESSWYLRDRAKGIVDTSFVWAVVQAVDGGHGEISDLASSRLVISQRGGKRPTDASLETITRRHLNFLEWCDWNKKHAFKGHVQNDEPVWKHVTYEDLTESYATQMMSGTWGHHSLEPSTINSRVDEACFFLHWASIRGLREPFHVDVYLRPRRRGGNRSDSHKLTTAASRTQRVREKPVNLTLPRPADVDRWLKCVETEKGYVKGLMCRLIGASGIRREECAQWRIWTIPEHRHEWKISLSGSYLTVTISHGTKGEKYVDEYGDQIGPTRSINIPIEIAEEMHHYREFIRPKFRTKYIRSVDLRRKLTHFAA